MTSHICPSVSPSVRPSIFRFQMITWVIIHGFSLNLVFVLILWRSGLGVLTGKFRQILSELSARDMPIFSFLDDTLCKCQAILMPASVAQLDAPSDWRPGGRGFNPRRGRQHSFVEIDHEIFSTVILSLPLIQEGQLLVSGERMCTILVNRLEDLACPVNVWLGKLTALDMTPLGWLGRKTSTQTNKRF